MQGYEERLRQTVVYLREDIQRISFLGRNNCEQHIVVFH